MRLISRIARVALGLLMSIALCGCGRGAGPARPVVGVTMAHFDDNFLTMIRSAMVEHAAAFPDIELQFADAQGDVGRQLSQIQNFVTQDAAAIIVNAADTSATPGMTKIARDAGVPLVYVNRRPAEDTLPSGVVFVGSDDLQAGTLEMEELARLMSYRGRVAIMVGELASNGAQLRTKAVEIVVAKYPGMKIVEKQVGNFQRERGLDLMNNWLTAGAAIDAVASNNDEMAIGAIMAIQQAARRGRKDPRRRRRRDAGCARRSREGHARGHRISECPRPGARRARRGGEVVTRRAGRQLRVDSFRARHAGELQGLSGSVDLNLDFRLW